MEERGPLLCENQETRGMGICLQLKPIVYLVVFQERRHLVAVQVREAGACLVW